MMTIWDNLREFSATVAGRVTDWISAAQVQGRQTAFAVALIALSAKMAKADGHVTQDEIDAFAVLFEAPPQEAGTVRRLYDLARRDAAGFEHYARQIQRIYAGEPAVLEDVLDALYYIAMADGVMHPAEEAFLDVCADIFGFPSDEARRIKAGHMGDGTLDPYGVLGVTPDASALEIKAAYRALARDHHPDALIARGVPPDFVAAGEQKMQVVNTAYEQILKERGGSVGQTI